jgi:hypothetical protein
MPIHNEIDLSSFNLPVSGLPPDEDTKLFNKLLDKALIEINPPQAAKYFRASFICTEPCKRAIVLSTLFPPPQEKNSHALAIFNDGTWRHLRIAEWIKTLKKLGLAKTIAFEEEWVSEKYWMSGHIDSIIEFSAEPLNNLGLIVLEIKGINANGFKELSNPKRSHYLQAQIYMAVRKAKWGFIIYESKDTQFRKIFKIAFDQKEVTRILQRMKKLKAYREKFLSHEEKQPGDLPDPEWHEWCSGCKWKKQCLMFHQKNI